MNEKVINAYPYIKFNGNLDVIMSEDLEKKIYSVVNELTEVLKRNDLAYCEAIAALDTCKAVMEIKCKIN